MSHRRRSEQIKRSQRKTQRNPKAYRSEAEGPRAKLPEKGRMQRRFQWDPTRPVTTPPEVELDGQDIEDG